MLHNFNEKPDIKLLELPLSFVPDFSSKPY